MPEGIWELLAAFFNALEGHENPIWPPALTWGSIPLLPKDGPPSPLNLRPLTILSVIYRIWAGIRASQLRQWQESWIHPSLHGGRAGHETLDGVFETDLHIELAQEAGTNLYLLLLDYRKFFDFIIQEIIWGLASWWGMPEGIVRLLRAFYQKLLSVFKFQGHFGNPWQRTNSLAQGCSFSMMLVNLPVTAWAIAILHNLHKNVAGISAYVDDKVIRSPSWTHLQILLERTIHFDTLAGQFLNFDKSNGLSTTNAGRKNLKTLTVQGTPLLIVKDAKSLGALVTTAMNPKSFIAKKRVANAVLTVKRLQHLPIELHKKAFFFINAKVAPQACFGSSTIDVPIGQLRQLEAAIVQTLWGNHHALRSRELCFGALWDPLKVHPQWLSILYSFRDLRRIKFKRDDLMIKFLARFKKRIENRYHFSARDLPEHYSCI